MNTKSMLAAFSESLRSPRSLLAAAGAATAAVELKEGVNYKLLQPAQPTNVAPGKVEVVEVFWYACGHCYLLEPKLEAWDRSGRPANAQLVRVASHLEQHAEDTRTRLLHDGAARQAEPASGDLARDQPEGQPARHTCIRSKRSSRRTA